jgi:hypothetical protein
VDLSSMMIVHPRESRVTLTDRPVPSLDDELELLELEPDPDELDRTETELLAEWPPEDRADVRAEL